MMFNRGATVILYYSKELHYSVVYVCIYVRRYICTCIYMCVYVYTYVSTGMRNV